ncbi:MAG TPA: rRNA biogenesis protein [Candidatus Methanoperedens sp.]
MEKINAWFGIFTLEEERIIDVELFNKDLDALSDRLMDEPLLLRGTIEGADLRELAIRYGFVDSVDEYDLMLHELNILLAKKKLAHAVGPDRQIIASVEAIDDIDETSNILAVRLKEWYMLDFNDTDLKGEELALHIIKMDQDVQEMIRDFASGLLGLYSMRRSIEEYLEANMPVIAPNLTLIAGPILGARLLSMAGSLEKLASMPSSTIQVIGANNALFKHLRGRASSPKHGVIFRHPYVNTAPRKLRGKVARAVASRISLAARYDFYSGELKENLSSGLDKKIFYIKQHFVKNRSRK